MNATHSTCSFGHFAMVSLVFLPLAPRHVAGSSIAGLVPAGVLELIEQLFLQLHLLKLWLAFIAQVGVPL
jgi:hypothetical protein